MPPASFAIYDDIPLAVCVLRKTRKAIDILYANNAFQAIAGQSQLTGQEFQKIWPGSDGFTFINKLKSVTPPRNYVLRADTNAAARRWVNFLITEENIDGSDVFILWGTDISATKEHEEELVAAVQKADAMAEMKSNFLATMSHEIRTPMQTIYGLLELIADEKPSVQIASMVGTAQGAASGLLEILDDILDLAKMDANKMGLDVFEVPVRTLVRGILEAMAVKVHGKNIKLIDKISDDVPFVVIGDPKRLRQIIINLCGNALKFTESGSVTVTVSRQVAHIKPQDKQTALRFEITDTGIGMDSDACGRMFQSFSQADNSTARKYGGTGLGLSICKKLVELMGGQIGVFSEPGKGSTFWFEIVTEEVNVNTTTVQLPVLDGISVLSVEDHPQGAKEIINSLRSMGAKVESCGTYKEALALIERRPFDVAVIDQGLPDGLGLDLMKAAMAIRPYMGLVMYTVRDDSGLQHSLQALGATYLSKPAGRAGLGEAVKNAASKVTRVKMDGPSRLLIAEDTESVRDVLRRQLEKTGVEADFAHDGLQALDLIQTGKYGILITDLHMPHMDGYGLVKKIRENEKQNNALGHFPVIVLTADVQMAQRDVYLSHGFDECLLKPVSLGQFRRLLMRWGLVGEIAVSSDSPPVNKNETKSVSSIDLTAIKDMMGAFDESTIEMLKMFSGMTKPLIEKINTAYQAKNFHALAETAHSLKGAARSACCTRLGDLASSLQTIAETGQDGGDLTQKINIEFENVCKEIENLKLPSQ